MSKKKTTKNVTFRPTPEQEEAMRNWDLYSEKYRTYTRKNYWKLYEEKKKYNLRVNRLKKEVFEDLADSELLSIADREKMIEWLKNHDIVKINCENHRIRLILESYSFRTLTAWFNDTEMQLKKMGYRGKFRYTVGGGGFNNANRNAGFKRVSGKEK